MARQLKWTPAAREDLRELARYIARDSRFQASRVVDVIIVCAEGALINPFAATICPELRDDNIRHRNVFSRRVIYEIRGDLIVVMAILHERRLFDRVADRFS